MRQSGQAKQKLMSAIDLFSQRIEQHKSGFQM